MKDIAQKIVVAQATLLAMRTQAYNGSIPEFVKFHSLERQLQEIFNDVMETWKPVTRETEPMTYREEQASWRAAGWDAYNSDMVDEFPGW